VTNLITDQLRQLAGTLSDLKGRVRRAVAGEVGKAVADAVGEILAAALSGEVIARARAFPSRGYAPARPHAYGRDDWDDPDSPGWDPDYARLRRRAADDPDESMTETGQAEALMPAALAVAVAAGRWWLARRGSPLQAAGAGLAAGAALLAGGRAVRTALAVLLAVHRLMSATDALGDAAETLDRD
jgi:hypothetical protein